MAEAVAQYETAIRLGFFFAVLAVIAAWEVAAPRRSLTHSRPLRWSANLGIVTLNTVLLRLLLPVPLLAFATLAETRGWGRTSMSRLSCPVSRCQPSLPRGEPAGTSGGASM